MRRFCNEANKSCLFINDFPLYPKTMINENYIILGRKKKSLSLNYETDELLFHNNINCHLFIQKFLHNHIPKIVFYEF